MKIWDVVSKLGLTVLNQGWEDNVAGCYIGDLLSRVISRSVAGGVWVTIMNNFNVPAVALLAEVPCILLAEGVEPMEGVTEKCSDEGIWLLKSELSAYDLAKQLAELGI